MKQWRHDVIYVTYKLEANGKLLFFIQIRTFSIKQSTYMYETEIDIAQCICHHRIFFVYYVGLCPFTTVGGDISCVNF